MIRNPRAGARKSGGFRLEVFTDDELREIHLATLEVLSRTGFFVEDEEALQIFEDGGADVDRERRVVCLPEQVVEGAIRSAPAKVVLCGRTPDHDVVLEDGRVGFTNFGEGIQVVDPARSTLLRRVGSKLQNSASSTPARVSRCESRAGVSSRAVGRGRCGSAT